MINVALDCRNDQNLSALELELCEVQVSHTVLAWQKRGSKECWRERRRLRHQVLPRFYWRFALRLAYVVIAGTAGILSTHFTRQDRSVTEKYDVAATSDGRGGWECKKICSHGCHSRVAEQQTCDVDASGNKTKQHQVLRVHETSRFRVQSSHSPHA